MRSFTLVLSFLFILPGFVFPLKGQTSKAGAKHIISPELLFQRFYSSHGLPDNRIRSLYQDRKGFLWVGTMNGISKYDGYGFKKFYKTKDAQGIAGNWVYDICEDDSGNIYIGTLGGLNRYEVTREKFVNFKNRSGNRDALFNEEITALFLDKRGKLWIGTKYGLAKYDPVTDKFESFNKYPFNTRISKIIESYDGRIWISTAGGVVHYNIDTDVHQFYKLEVKPNPFGDKLWSLFEDNKNLYVATGGDGLVKLMFDPAKNAYGKFEYLNTFANSQENLVNTQIFDICKSAAGDFWLGTARGLVKIEKINTAAPSIFFYQNNPLNNQSLSDNAVYQVFIDKTEVLWCGTEHGLNKLDLHLLPFHYYTFTDQKSLDQVRSLFTKDGINIWLGTSKSGLYKYNYTDGSVKAFQSSPASSFQNAHRSLLVDTNNDIWLGTLGGTLKGKEAALPQARKVVAGLTTFALIEDSKGNTWVGTNNGLFKIDKQGKQTKYLPDAENPTTLPSRFIRAIYEDHSGNIWIGFENKGVAILNPDKEIFTRIDKENAENPVFGSTIYSILEYPEKVMWVGSESGLNKITLQEDRRGHGRFIVKSYLEEHGLPDKSVNGILADNQGSLWISTIKGLIRFNIKQERFYNYLPNLNFSYSSYYKFNDNKLLFGTSNGFVIFDPAQVTTDSHTPEVVISDFKLFNKEVGIRTPFNGEVVLKQSITNTREITLGYKNNVFTLGFSSLHFANPENNSYAYQLEGFDQGWNYASAANRSATYTNLNPGTYLFKIKASDNFGRWSTSPAVLKINILPPPWKTWWAITAYIVAFNILLFVFIRYIVIQYKQRQQIDFDQLEKEQLKNLNKMKLKFFTDISHEFRTPLSLITGPVEDLLASAQVTGLMKQKMLLVQRNCKNLLYLLDELMTFQKMDQGMLKLKLVKTNIIDLVKEVYDNFELLAHKNDVRYQLICEKDHFNIWFDTGKMSMVLNNLIFNAFKFTPAGGAIQVKIFETTQLPPDAPVESREVTGWLCIAVEDTGKGIAKEELEHVFERFFQGNSCVNGTGIGLSLSKSLVELHHGLITVESTPNVRTCFQVFLPLSNQHAGPEKEATGSLGTVVGSPQKEAEWFVLQDEMPLAPTKIKAMPPAGQVETERPELLIVDDNPEVLDFLEMLFAPAYHTFRALNGKEALEKIKKREPDLVVSDVMMPEMDGIELCRILKNQIATCHIPVILLTAKSTVENVIEGIETGADDYIPKPFHPELMRVKVEKLIAAQKRLISKFQANSIIIPKDINRNPLDALLLEKVIDSIKENMSNEEFSVEELGSLVGMSRSNLFRKLKAIINQTPIEFIYTIRLKYALELLLERKLNISEIAYEVGFKNPSSFSKSFKKQFGKAPSEYLNEVLEARES